eukprot:3065200-Pyramimonas_sp.AAC.1
MSTCMSGHDVAGAGRGNTQVYNTECKSRAGFCIAFTDPSSVRASYEEFVKVSFRWHNKMTKSLGMCLESKEYVHIRNALIVLSKIVKVYSLPPSAIGARYGYILSPLP